MRTFVASSLIALASLLATNPAHAAECGTVSIAEMDWESASLLANVDAIILSSGYDCDVSLVPGDTMSTFATMNEVGEPEIAPELWINAYRDSFDAAVEAGRLRIAAKALSDGGVEGWWIPNYIA
ncbi:MAG: glycine betaine ABC transporter substrate-binding protein, partial [Pseudomonadota bacterium]